MKKLHQHVAPGTTTANSDPIAANANDGKPGPDIAPVSSTPQSDLPEVALPESAREPILGSDDVPLGESGHAGAGLGSQGSQGNAQGEVFLLPPTDLTVAEGYLELVTGPAVRLGISRSMRRQGASLALRQARLCGDLSGVDATWEGRRMLIVGQALRLLGRYPAAITALRKASRERTLRPSALLAIGCCCKRMGRVDQAIVCLTRALSILPEDARLHYNLACYLALAGQGRAALYELAWALELEPRLRSAASSESDFDSVRPLPTFEALTAGSGRATHCVSQRLP